MKIMWDTQDAGTPCTRISVIIDHLCACFISYREKGICHLFLWVAERLTGIVQPQLFWGILRVQSIFRLEYQSIDLVDTEENAFARFVVGRLMCFFLLPCRTTWIKRTKESGRAMQQDHKQFERSLNFQLPKQRTTAWVCRAEGTGCSGWLAFSLHTGTAAHLLPETGRFGASPFHYWQAVSGHLTLLSQTTLPKGKCPPEQANGLWLTANISALT